MIDKVINGLVQSIVNSFQSYGLKMESQYNPDLDEITQYSKSMNMRSMFTEKQLELLTPDQIELFNKQSYILLMYDYSPLYRSETRMNNIDFQLVFNPNSTENIPEFGKLRKVAEDDLSQFFTRIRDANATPPWTPTVDGDNNIELSSYPNASGTYVVTGLLSSPANSPIGPISNDDFVIFNEELELQEITIGVIPDMQAGQCRDMIMGRVDLNIKILTSNTTLINSLQFVHVSRLQRNKSLDIDLDFGSNVGVHTFEYESKFDPIEDSGHVNYNLYGNLQAISFNVSIEGPFFSFYAAEEHYLETIDVQVKVAAGDTSPDQP